MTVVLKDVTLNNYFSVINLAVRQSQENFVATNAVSLAEAYVYQNAGHFIKPFAIYDENVLIGFTLLAYDTNLAISPSNYLLFRLMIDEKYQGKGYFKDAMDCILAYVKSFPAGVAKYLWISYEMENSHARLSYLKYGFNETGEKYEDELVALYDLSK